MSVYPLPIVHWLLLEMNYFWFTGAESSCFSAQYDPTEFIIQSAYFFFSPKKTPLKNVCFGQKHFFQETTSSFERKTLLKHADEGHIKQINMNNRDFENNTNFEILLKARWIFRPNQVLHNKQFASVCPSSYGWMFTFIKIINTVCVIWLHERTRCSSFNTQINNRSSCRTHISTLWIYYNTY